MQAIVIVSTRACLAPLAGVLLLTRTLRTLREANVGAITVLAGQDAGPEVAARARRAQAGIAWGERPDGLTAQDLRAACPPSGEAALLIPADVVWDVRLVRALTAAPAPAVLVDSEPSPELRPLLAPARATRWGTLCGAALLRREDLDGEGSLDDLLAHRLERGGVTHVDVATLPTYAPGLRRHLRPYWFHAPGLAGRDIAARFMISATQKGAQDVPALVHAPIENMAVQWLAPLGVTPNQITLLTIATALVGTACFATGRLGLGVAIALVVGVLDGIDGKLARLKLETSRVGELEHLFDVLYEFSWWGALAFHFQVTGQLERAWLSLPMLIAMDAIGVVAKLSVQHRTGRLIEEFGAFDRAVRWFGARRNVYVWILVGGILVGAAADAFALLPWWAAATTLIHVPRALWIVRHHARRAQSAQA